MDRLAIGTIFYIRYRGTTKRNSQMDSRLIRTIFGDIILTEGASDSGIQSIDVDIQQDHEKIVLSVGVPGIAKEAVDLVTEPDMLVLKVTQGNAFVPKGTWIYKVDAEYDTEKTTAAHANGLLTITVPRKAPGKKIEIT